MYVMVCQKTMSISFHHSVFSHSIHLLQVPFNDLFISICCSVEAHMYVSTPTVLWLFAVFNFITSHIVCNLWNRVVAQFLFPLWLEKVRTRHAFLVMFVMNVFSLSLLSGLSVKTKSPALPACWGGCSVLG